MSHLHRKQERGITVQWVPLKEGWHTQTSECAFILLNITLLTFRENILSFVVFKSLDDLMRRWDWSEILHHL